MTVIYNAGLICDDVYRLVVARFKVLRYATAVLSLFRRKSLTEEEKGKIRAFSYCVLTQRYIALKVNKFKIVVRSFRYSITNYYVREKK